MFISDPLVYFQIISDQTASQDAHFVSRRSQNAMVCFCGRTSQSELESESCDQRKEKLGGKSSKLCRQTGLKAMCGAQTRCISNANEALRPSADPRGATRLKVTGNVRDPLKYETS